MQPLERSGGRETPLLTPARWKESGTILEAGGEAKRVEMTTGMKNDESNPNVQMLKAQTGREPYVIYTFRHL
jgi:hypothetical protein